MGACMVPSHLHEYVDGRCVYCGKPRLEAVVVTDDWKAALIRCNEARRRRDDALVEARAMGLTVTEIAAAVGLTKGRVSQICSAALHDAAGTADQPRKENR